MTRRLCGRCVTLPFRFVPIRPDKNHRNSTSLPLHLRDTQTARHGKGKCARFASLVLSCAALQTRYGTQRCSDAASHAMGTDSVRESGQVRCGNAEQRPRHLRETCTHSLEKREHQLGESDLWPRVFRAWAFNAWEEREVPIRTQAAGPQRYTHRPQVRTEPLRLRQRGLTTLDDDEGRRLRLLARTPSDCVGLSTSFHVRAAQTGGETERQVPLGISRPCSNG
jgi:hypothetical protein